MVISICQAVVTYVPLLWFVRVADGMPDPAQRDLLMRQEASRQTGGRVTLSAAEQKLDVYLHRLKEKEMSAEQFPPAIHFFKAKPLIQKSPIFKLLQKMPKGDVIRVDEEGLPHTGLLNIIAEQYTEARISLKYINGKIKLFSSQALFYNFL